MREVFAVLAVFAVLLLVFGCAGGMNPPAPGAQPSQPLPADLEAKPIGQEHPTINTVSPEQAKSDLTAYFNMQAGLEYSVNYLVISSITGVNNMEYFVKKGAVSNCSITFGEWKCPTSGPDKVSTPISVIMWYLDDKNYTARQLQSRGIAGVSAKCYEVSNVGSLDNQIYDYCFSPEGVLLYNDLKRIPNPMNLYSNWTATRYSMGLD